MKPWLLLIAVCSYWLAGCASGDTELLERELRLQEDKIFQLQYELEEQCALLDECEQGTGVASSRRSTDTGDDPAAPGTTRPPRVDLGVPAEIQAPAVDGDYAPGPDDTDLSPPPRFRRPGDQDAADAEQQLPQVELPALDEEGFDGALSFPPEQVYDSALVAGITIDPQATGGRRLRGVSGAGGLTVVIEPRDEAGQIIPAAADMAIVVLDPSVTGKAARVARWDLDTDAVGAMFRDMPGGKKLNLRLDWPGPAPAHRQLHLYVRYLTSDGRKLQADQPIDIAATPSRTTGWSPSLLRPPQEEYYAPAQPPAERMAVRPPDDDRASGAQRGRGGAWSPYR